MGFQESGPEARGRGGAGQEGTQLCLTGKPIEDGPLQAGRAPPCGLLAVPGVHPGAVLCMARSSAPSLSSTDSTH